MADETLDLENVPEDVNVITSDEEMLQAHPLIRLLGDHPKTRFLVILLNVAPRRLSPTDIVDRAGLSSRNPWYNYRDELLESGLIVEDGNAGNSPLYRVATSEEEGDPRWEWLEDLEDYTAAVFRDGDRPSQQADE